MGLSPGDRVDRYEVIELLGAGGMGEVYRARDRRLARLVALKILHVDSGPGTDGAARLLREARAAAALSHANVLAVYDVGEVQEPESLRGLAYIAMELVVGRSLRACLGDRSVSLERRVGWLRDIAAALGAAHKAGIVHRDVKPENVMIRADDGAVKVLDFGIARRVMTVVDRQASTAGQSVPTSNDVAETEELLGTLTEQGKAIGTLYYMAPEQLRAEGIDGRADQFAWGVMAYELLTGVGPWQKSADPLITVSEILSLTPRPPIEIESSIPRSLSDAINRALAKQRGGRFPTMEALLAAMDRAAGATEPLAYEARSEPKAVTVPVSRIRTLAVWTIGLAASVLAIGGVFLGRRAHVQPARMDAAAPPAACTNRSCVEGHRGEPYVCRNNACVAITSEDCTPMYEPGDLTSEDTVWLGAMFPTKGPITGANGPMNMGGTDFARKEIAEATAALKRSSPTLKIRRIALAGCDDGADAARAARHLVDDLDVPAILGFRSGRELIDLEQSLLLPRQVLAVASLTGNPGITRLPQPSNLPKMVWRTTVSSDRMAEGAARIIEGVLETQHSDGRTHITLVRPEGATGLLAFAETFYRHLHFNGRSAIENGGAYQEIVFPAGTLSKASVTTLAERVVATTPSILVVLGGDSSAELPLVEQVEERAKGARPIYLAPFQSTDTFKEFLGKSAQRRHRLFTIQSTSNTMANARFVIRYNESGRDHIERGINPGVSYDAFYLLAYATFAVGSAPVTGPSLAAAIGRLLPPGPQIEAGPTQVYEAIGALSAGGRIDLQGASTALDFDPSTGEEPADFALVCSGVSADGQASGEDLESGVFVMAKSGRVEGSIHCP